MRNDARLACALCMLLTTGLQACAATASELRPNQIPRGEGAVVGRVRVWKGDDEVTGSCFAEFVDDKGELEPRVSLDDTGWIFTTLRLGPTHLAAVSCVVWNGLGYLAHALDFDVAGNGKTTYFGHVRFDLADEDMKMLGEATLNSVPAVPVASVAGAIASTAVTATGVAIVEASPDGKNRVSVENRSDDATRRYRSRYRRNPEVVVSIVGHPPEPRPVAAPALAKREDDAARTQAQASSEVALDGVRLVWWAIARSDTRKIGFRLQRYARKPELEACSEIELTIDDQSMRLPLVYSADHSSAVIKETIEVEAELATLKAITGAKSVAFKACSLVRRLSTQDIGAAGKVAVAYESLLSKLPVAAGPVPAPETPVPEASAVVEPRP